MEKKVVERFVRYAKKHTTSDPKSESFPSTSRQLNFAKDLVNELIEIGLQEVEMDKNGYVMATIPSNIKNACPVVGFVAHMDTSPDFSGENVDPQFVEKYNGEVLNIGSNVTLDPIEFPELKKYIGQKLITTNGKTLLGADDKAGLSEIVTAMEVLINSPEIKHGKIRVCFTPDEEIGKGADKFDVPKFGADFAYTLDGGEIGELEYENFNAAGATIKIKGKSVHPGASKNKMVNAILVGHQLIEMLPQAQRPEYTEGYEGFFHLTSFNGDVSNTELEYIIRDHNMEKFKTKKQLLIKVVELLNFKFGEGTVLLEMNDQYYNMKEKVEPQMFIVDIAHEAMVQVGVKPIVRAIRGGTDGARLSYMGLPCPNIFAGGHNFHGPYEFVPVQSMVKAVEVILTICKLVANK